VPIPTSTTTGEFAQSAVIESSSTQQVKKDRRISGKPILDSPLLKRHGVSTFSVREDDIELTSIRLVFKTCRNDGKIYDALIQLAVSNGGLTDDGAFTITIGYSALTKASGCQTRALGRARPRLIDWGFLRSFEPHADRQPTKYVVRSIACLDAIYRDAGCTHLRITPGGKMQPFRSAPNSGGN